MIISSIDIILEFMNVFVLSIHSWPLDLSGLISSIVAIILLVWIASFWVVVPIRLSLNSIFLRVSIAIQSRTIVVIILAPNLINACLITFPIEHFLNVIYSALATKIHIIFLYLCIDFIILLFFLLPF